jgi:hypothetical protein
MRSQWLLAYRHLHLLAITDELILFYVGGIIVLAPALAFLHRYQVEWKQGKWSTYIPGLDSAGDDVR